MNSIGLHEADANDGSKSVGFCVWWLYVTTLCEVGRRKHGACVKEDANGAAVKCSKESFNVKLDE